MKKLWPYYFFFLVFCLPVLLLQNTGCIKEYSFEGASQDIVPRDTIPADTTRTDTLDTIVPPPAIIFPQCDFCKESNQVDLGHWSFKVGDTYLCGTFSDAGFFSGQSKMNFTFFGPSACSEDTGIVVSVYLTVPLDRDRYGLTTDETAFYYYDHNSPNDILDSRHTATFTVVVQSFINATGIVTGTFSGDVYTVNGDIVHITDGQFKAALN
jgi:hypothetical protein